MVPKVEPPPPPRLYVNHGTGFFKAHLDKVLKPIRLKENGTGPIWEP